MYQPKMKKDIRCPLEYGLAIFGGKWKSRIICVLAAQAPLRYSVLRKEMGKYYRCSAVIDVERTHARWHGTPDFLR